MTNDDLSMCMSKSPWTNVYGLARSLLAIGTLGTLVANRAETLFRPLGTAAYDHTSLWIMKSSLFALLNFNLELARWIAILGLCLVISGWRPRLTALLHWWISFSLFVSCATVDGGDQAAAVLSFLLLPLALTDSRRSHWESADQEAALGRFESARRMIANSAIWMIRLQVAIIYFHAAVAKFSVAEWKNGTALYYWILDPSLGAPSWLVPIVKPLLGSSLLVMIATWTVLGFEVLLFMGLTLSERWKSKLLIFGIVFHLAIGLSFGLVSFFFSMAASLILFLRPVDRPLQPRSWLEGLRTATA